MHNLHSLIVNTQKESIIRIITCKLKIQTITNEVIYLVKFYKLIDLKALQLRN